MINKWQATQAEIYLQSQDIEINKKSIYAKNGLKGLKACSALDYLIKCGYRYSSEIF